MNEQPLTERVKELFEWALARTATCLGLVDLHRLLADGQARLLAPMRVAIIGRIKAGKSTAMNALLGHILVPTGTEEVTFNVTWFQWNESPALLVYYKDGRKEPRPFAELEALTRRSKERMPELLAIDYIVANYPHALLQRINLVDTPGLASFYGEDSENAQRFIGLTEREAARADAVLYLFDRSIADTEQDVLEEFVGPSMGQMTPLNAIGVLTQVDTYWPSEAAPMRAATRVVERLRALPDVRRTLYTIVQVCGLLALGAQTLTTDEFEALRRLADLPEERFDQLMETATDFTTMADDDLAVTPADRQRLLNRLGWYGVWLAYQRIRAGVTDLTQLRSELLEEHSGLPQLRQLILSHFGNRAFLIKLDKILREVTASDFQLRPRVGGEEHTVLRDVMKHFDALRSEQHSVKELDVLRRHYEGRLDLNGEEIEMLLQVTGENGTTCSQRLGMVDTAPEELLSAAKTRIGYWKGVAMDGGCDVATAEAAKVLARSYERIAYHVEEALRARTAAQKHLDFVL